MLHCGQVLVACLGLLQVTRAAPPRDAQRPLTSRTTRDHPRAPTTPPSNVTEELILAEIIPTVTDHFVPLLDLAVSWPGASAQLGNTIKPGLLQEEPQVYLSTVSGSSRSPRRRNVHPSTDIPLKPVSEDTVYEQFVVVLTDPDAKSRDNPKWAEFCHWIAYWAPTSNPPVMAGSGSKKEEIVPYKPPAAPPKTWKHRYVFLVLTPLNGTTDKLHLSVPSGRQRWGNDKVRTGVRQWAKQNGLGVVGANFIYSKHKKQ